MQTRRFHFNTREVLIPVVGTLLLGVALLFLLTPGIGSTSSADPGVIRIYSSVPLNGFASINHGAEMAFEEANYEAGGMRISFVTLNGAPEIGGKWSADVELANARRAAADPDAMLYIGTYNSGAAKISIPVLNRVNMAMISPGNTYAGLTKPGTGTAGEPWTYFPTGTRNYFRVVPADDLQGAAAAAYARELGAKRVYVLDDRELYGAGIAAIFARSAKELGLEVVGGPESIDVRAQNFTDLAMKIRDAGPDLVYFGGITANKPALVLRALREVGFFGDFMGADGIGDAAFIEQSQDRSERVYSTLVGLPVAKFQGPGAEWYQRYIARYSNDDNKDFAPFGYEAARVAISAINRAGAKDREKIRAAVAQTTSADLQGDPILGDWSFDANGDTSLVTISVQRMGAEWTYRGLMSFDPDAKKWSFQEEP